MNTALLNEAQGYFDLELWKEAWEATEKLAKYEKANPEVAALRLQIVVKLALWEKGEEVADLVGESPAIELRRLSAQYFLDRARDTYEEGDRPEAHRQFQKSIEKWPGIRREFTERDVERFEG